jgi:anti-sigma factor RsiW
MPDQDTKSDADRSVSHPTAEEWMDFLYGECAEERRAAMETHASQCPDCAQRVKEWRASLSELDEWKLPAAEHSVSKTITQRFAPLVKWAVAAVVLLSTGFLAGQFSSNSGKEIAALKSSVAGLSERMQQNLTAQTNNTLVVATEVANNEANRLLAEYSASQEARRLADQKSVGQVLAALELRLDNLHSELTTVALNTQTGFHRTHENLIALASLSVSSQNVENLNSTSQQQ